MIVLGSTHDMVTCSENSVRRSLLVHWVKDPALSPQWLRLSPWPGNFHMPQKMFHSFFPLPISCLGQFTHLLSNSSHMENEACCFFFFPKGPCPWHMEVPRLSKGQIGATAAGLCHSNSGSEPCLTYTTAHSNTGSPTH